MGVNTKFTILHQHQVEKCLLDFDIDIEADKVAQFALNWIELNYVLGIQI